MNLFVDMDRVLVDIDKGFRLRFNKDPSELSDDEWWATARSVPDFFETLPPSHDFDNIITTADVLFSQKWHVLSACPRRDYLNVARQKRNWLNKYNLTDIMLLPAPNAAGKAAFLQRPGDVLIDDRLSNLEEWKAAGGVSLLYNCNTPGWDLHHKELVRLKHD